MKTKRIIWMVFFGEPKHEAAEHAEESPPVMTVPLMVLAALCRIAAMSVVRSMMKHEKSTVSFRLLSPQFLPFWQFCLPCFFR